MLWLYLLGAVTFLTIALRRVLRRQAPLSDELYSSKVAVEHVHSGVAFVTGDGKLGSLNQSLAETLCVKPSDLVGHEWLLMFPNKERHKVREAHAQMLLQGIATIDTLAERSDGSQAAIHLRLVTAHDHKMRVMGHHAMVHDISRERALEEQLKQLGQPTAAAR